MGAIARIYTTEEMFANQKAYRQTLTTLMFEFDDFQFEDELNELLANDDGYKINRQFFEQWQGCMVTTQIVYIETNSRADALRLYDDIHNWADDDSNSVYINYSSII